MAICLYGNPLLKKLKGLLKGPCPNSRKEKARISNTGKVRSEEQKKHYSESNLKRPTITYPHCRVSSKVKTSMNRYHFDNCKLVKSIRESCKEK